MNTKMLTARNMRLPSARGPLSRHVVEALVAPVHELSHGPDITDDPLTGDDFHLALYLCYELHYTGLQDVDPAWEWEPSLLGFRRRLEAAFEEALRAAVPAVADDDVPEALRALTEKEGGPSLSRHLETEASLERFQEFVIHRSAYQLKEADPHSWAVPRLSGKAKAALVEIQTDEYGSGDAASIHAVLFGHTMRALGLDDSYGAYIGRLPGVTLATVNLMSMFGLHRRWRGAIVGHLALFEMSSTEPNRRYGNGLRRLGFGREATWFYDEHVEADAVHEAIAAHDLAGSLVREDPEAAPDVMFGARCMWHLDELWLQHLWSAWGSGRSSLF